MAEKPYIVEDVEIGVQRVSSGHDGAIVGNLDGVVERVQVDAVNDERHLGGFEVTGAVVGCSKGVERRRRRRGRGRWNFRIGGSLKNCTRSVMK
jgi:hypothetical protein